MRDNGLPVVYPIVDIRRETERISSFVLDGSLEAAPGQFVMAWLPGIDEKPFSLAEADPIILSVARVGPFTEAFHRLAVGDRVWLRGPFGQGFRLCEGDPLLVGGGYGAAPLAYLARVACEAGRLVTVVLGTGSAQKAPLVERFRALGCTLNIFQHRETGLPLIERLLLESTTDTLYACGPNAMLEATKQLALRHNRPCQLSYEAYMRCGIGVCGACSRDGYLICRDGPVLAFPARDGIDGSIRPQSSTGRRCDLSW
jgi:dihydroorotate dehydrogenase electron transfer subunit